MNSTLILDPVLLSFLIPCYYQNLRGDFEKYPLFQHSQQQLTIIGYNSLFHLHFENMHSLTISPLFLCNNSTT